MVADLWRGELREERGCGWVVDSVHRCVAILPEKVGLFCGDVDCREGDGCCAGERWASWPRSAEFSDELSALSGFPSEGDVDLGRHFLTGRAQSWIFGRCLDGGRCRRRLGCGRCRLWSRARRRSPLLFRWCSFHCMRPTQWRPRRQGRRRRHGDGERRPVLLLSHQYVGCRNVET